MEQVCRDCEFDESATPPRAVAEALPGLARAIVASVRALPAETARARPAPEVWSPIEYLGHLRESMAFHRWLIE